MKPRKLLAALAVTALILASCSPSVEESAEDLCSSLEALSDTVQQIAGADVSPGTITVDTVKSAVDEMESAVQDVQNAESGLSDALKSQLQSDFDELQSSVQDISGDSTLAEAAQDVVSAIAAFKESWDQTLSELNCEPSN